MKITVADYIAKRLEQLGIKHVFGLPGDYNFNLLDAIERNENLKWVNSTNELNAGYCADGYARINGYGALITTFGVGELSAINAVAGSYAENIPIVHIAGVPSTSSIKKNALLHHNFQKPNYFAFERAYSNVVESGAYLNEQNTKKEIDRVFDIMIKTKRPVYLAVPIDICFLETDDEIPDTNIKSDKKVLDDAVFHIEKLYNTAKKPLILYDYPVKRYNASKNVETLCLNTNTPVSSMVMGKGALSEDFCLFIGTNYGKLSDNDFKSLYESFDLIINIGALFSDLNTAGFSLLSDERFKINIEPFCVKVEGIKYENVYFIDLIDKLSLVLQKKENTVNIQPKGYDTLTQNEGAIKVNDIFPIVQNFLQKDDNLVVETGIMSLASGCIKLPSNCNYMSQTLWGSIGWATPAAFGAACADMSKRVVLLTGEGSHQLTVQEIANMFKHNIKPVILLLNNSGYTIERLLSNNPDDNFNNITSWNYAKINEFFKGDAVIKQIKIAKELKSALDEANACRDKMHYIEIFTDRYDVPEISKKAIENSRKYKKSQKNYSGG